MHIHLEVVGGIAGDMFCSAMLDAFPALEKPLQDFLSPLAFYQSYRCELNVKKQKEIIGKQFVVMQKHDLVRDKDHFVFKAYTPNSEHALVYPVASVDHQHYTWDTIQQKLKQIEPYSAIYGIASDIYYLLAKAESQIHGIELQSVSLHEVGADDALIDITSAAFLIYHSGVTSWSCSALPWGQGHVRCAHGVLPVPAPATLKILEGFDWLQDDEVGERITPTGAAILAWLIKQQGGTLSGKLQKSGYGCGQRQFRSKPNILRVNVFGGPDTDLLVRDSIYIIQCDVDDMTAENIAITQEKLRNEDGVIDLTCQTLMGKKGRWVSRFEVLCSKDKLEAICQILLIETTTLGVRFWPSERFKLTRKSVVINYDGQSWPVKIALRPDNQLTAKLEADAQQMIDRSYSGRQHIKIVIEQQAISEHQDLLIRKNYDE